MDEQRKLKRGLYFVHGYYLSDNENINENNPLPNRIILMKDNPEKIYNIKAFDLNIKDICISTISEGDYAYFDGNKLYAVEDDPTVNMYSELSRQLTNSISYANYGNQPIESSNQISNVYSYHVNIGHGNCSIIVFKENEEWKMWMVDCSVFDFTNRCNNSKKLDTCINNIAKDYGINSISKLLITHQHYDHINGIEHIIKKKYINQDTEVWINTQYPWKQATYIRILSQLNALGVRFIDPIRSNSTQHINILFPMISFNRRNIAPANKINNASVLYQICMDGKKMLFPGDIETEGWDQVITCMSYLKNSTYYCVSHHGSITGHLRNNCIAKRKISTLANCLNSNKTILMGRDGAYSGVYSKKVLTDFNNNLIKTEDANNYIKLEWSTGAITTV